MKVLFVPAIQSSAKYHFSGIAASKPLENKDDNKRRLNNSFLIGGGLTLLGAGIYLYTRRKPAKNMTKLEIADDIPIRPDKPVETKPKPQNKPEVKEVKQEVKPLPLPDEKLANSLPEFIRAKLSINNNYERFKNLLASQNKASIAGEGANSVVYNIDFLDEYVLKVVKPDIKADPNNIPVGLFPNNVNLGQPVWINPDNQRILLLKKVSGVPNSINNWSGTIYDKKLGKPLSVTKEQAFDYFEKITKISQLEQAVFDDLANQIQVLNTTPKHPNDLYPGFKTDSVNPNNLLVDFENNKLGVIDYFARNNDIYKNSHMDMVAMISDFTLYPEYYDHLNSSQQEKLLQCLKIIENKSFKAAEKVGLSTDKEIFLNFINKINKYFPIPSVKKSDTEEYIRSYDVRAKAFVDMFNYR